MNGLKFSTTVNSFSDTLLSIMGRKMSSTYSRILFHIVFATKNRSNILNLNLRNELFAFIGSLCIEKGGKLFQGGGIENHLHLLIETPPKIALSELMQFIKGNSARWINKNRKVDFRFAWQKGYGAFSVSQSAFETVRQYILNQEEHHRKFSFQQEYLSMLKKHNIPVNEADVFREESNE